MFMEDDGTHVYYGLRNGDDLESYKIGLHEKRDIKTAVAYVKHRFDANFTGGEEPKPGRITITGTNP